MNRAVRLVCPDNNPRNADVYDLETGNKLLNVYNIGLRVNRREIRVEIETTGPFEYEGPAELVDPFAREVLKAAKEVIATFGADQDAMTHLARTLHAYEQDKKRRGE